MYKLLIKTHCWLYVKPDGSLTSDTRQAWQTANVLEAQEKRNYYENQGYKCKFRHGVTVKHGFVDIRGHR